MLDTTATVRLNREAAGSEHAQTARAAQTHRHRDRYRKPSLHRWIDDEPGIKLIILRDASQAFRKAAVSNERLTIIATVLLWSVQESSARGAAPVEASQRMFMPVVEGCALQVESN